MVFPAENSETEYYSVNAKVRFNRDRTVSVVFTNEKLAKEFRNALLNLPAISIEQDAAR